MASLLKSKARDTDAATASIASVERANIPVSGMTCAACQSFVQRTLAEQAGVQDASVNLMLHNAAVTFDPRVVSAFGVGRKDSQYRIWCGASGCG